MPAFFSPTVYYDKTCKFWHLCNPFHRVISHWFSCSFDHFLYVLHCEIRHTVYSITKVCLPVIVRLPVNRFHCICINCYIVYLILCIWYSINLNSWCYSLAGPLHLLDIIYKDYVLFLLERWDVYWRNHIIKKTIFFLDLF